MQYDVYFPLELSTFRDIPNGQGDEPADDLTLPLQGTRQHREFVSSLCSWSHISAHKGLFCFPLSHLTPPSAPRGLTRSRSCSGGRRAGMLLGLGQMWVSGAGAGAQAAGPGLERVGKRERRGPAEGRSGGCQGRAGRAPAAGQSSVLRIPACPDQPMSTDCTHKVFRKIKGNHAYVWVFMAGFLWLAFYISLSFSWS